MRLVTLLLCILLIGGCATVPTENEVLAMSDQEFRLWARQAVKDLRTGQWVLVGTNVVTGVAMFVFLPTVVESAAARGAASAGAP